MRILYYLLFSLLSIINLCAQDLRFNHLGKFKIVQFTDLHYIEGDERAILAKECVVNVLEKENPDLVLFTGDIIFGRPAEKSLITMLEIVSKRNIPFGVTFGNHDDEQGLSKEDLFKRIQTLPYNLTSTVTGISGISNFALPIKSNQNDSVKSIIYCFDSHSYSQIEGINGYDYIKLDQINWYKLTSSQFTEMNGGRPIPSFCFFHIPLPEYNAAVTDKKTILIGNRGEIECSPHLNSGLFAVMKEQKDVKGIFVGHDHNNDYAVCWDGIMLAYGRYSGGNTVYNNLSNGARVIELTENEETFSSWIRLRDGSLINQLEFPTSFLKCEIK